MQLQPNLRSLDLYFFSLSSCYLIDASAIYSLSIECMFSLFDSIIFNSYNVGILRFTFELMFMDFWPLMDGFSHLEDQWPGFVMDG